MLIVSLSLLAGCSGPPTETPVLISECFPTIRASVWEDLDGNGVRDAGEGPLGGVEVSIFRGPGGNSSTDFGGFSDQAGVVEIHAIIGGDGCLEGHVAVLSVPEGYVGTTAERVNLTEFDYPNEILSFGLQPLGQRP